MDSLLWKMRATAQKYVDILAEILKIDVTVIDAQRIRVAGSGRMRKRIGDMSSYGYIVKHVLETKQTTAMKDPHECKICRECTRIEVCDNKSEVWAPLLVDDDCIGVLGFVCFDNRQVAHFEKNYDLFLQFLNQFADLIVSKAKDIIEAEKDKKVGQLLRYILDRAEIGILVFDKNNGITQINRAARKILQIPDYQEELPYTEYSATGTQILDLQEYQIDINKITYLVAGKFYDLNIEPYAKLFFFNTSSSAKEHVLGLTSKTEIRGLNRILGNSEAIINLKNQIRMIASSVSTVLITGESGTGKDLVAMSLHEESDRSNFPYVALNCGAIPENLLESELFGYVKGAFTGADSRGKVGLFRTANGGTLFLDEIGDMPSYLQVKLLRVLEQREIIPLGSDKSIKIDVRLIAATNKNMEELVSKGLFREDLYYRINVIPLKILPLRERKEDIQVLSLSFIEKYSSILNKIVRGISSEFWEKVESYPWPGNVRELQNTIEFVINMMPYTETLDIELLPQRFYKMGESKDINEEYNLSRIEYQMIKKALYMYGTSPTAKKQIAQILGISIATLYRKLKKYDL